MKINEIYSDLEIELANMRFNHRKDLIKRAKKLKQDSLTNYLKTNKLLELTEMLQILEYKEAMTDIKPKDKIKLKQVTLHGKYNKNNSIRKKFRQV